MSDASQPPHLPSRVAVPARPATNTPLSPLNEAHYHLWREVVAARRPAQRAARVAHASAVTILLIGAAGIVVGVAYPSVWGSLVVAGICTVGVVEYVGARRLRRAEPSAAILLGVNQLAFLGLITLYCIVRLASFSPVAAQAALGMSSLQTSLNQLPDVQADLQRQWDAWVPVIAYGFYSLIIALSLAYQGGLAVYYFTRRKYLLAFRRDTPAWIERLLAALEP